MFLYFNKTLKTNRKKFDVSCVIRSLRLWAKELQQIYQACYTLWVKKKQVTLLFPVTSSSDVDWFSKFFH